MAYSAQEKQYYDQLFNLIDKDNTGILPGQDAYPFLTSSNLPTATLGEVWAIADPENNGFLTKDAWYKAARVIGWIQKGNAGAVEESLTTKSGPLPTFDKGPPPPAQPPISAQVTGQRPTQPLSATTTGSGLPTLTSADRAKFTRLFAGCGPSNGLVGGDKARDMFVKSGLPYDKLAQIWNLSDTQDRGSLDLTDFIIGMYLIQSCMANPNLSLPPILPPGTYEQASGGRPPPVAGPASPISRQHTGGAVPSPVRPQYTGGIGSGILQPQGTGPSGIRAPATPPRSNTANQTFTSPPTTATFSTLPSTSSFGGPTRQGSNFIGQQQQQQQPWDVTPQAKATSDGFFAQLDTQGRGVIEGDVAVPFMIQSQLDENVLANIWDLADIRKEGKLTRDEFAVAMHLINLKLAGQDIPTTLPNSLVPPSLREEYGQGAQEVLNQGPSSATRDLFDLFADDEPAPTSKPAAAPQAQPPQQQQPQSQAFQPTSFLPQPPPPPARRMTAQGTGQKALSPAPTGQQAASGFGMAPFAPQSRGGGDLLGDDSADAAPWSALDHSADIGNKQNQLANTTRNLSELEKNHAELDQQAKGSAAELEDLEKKLSSARERHESETKAVADLRIRVGEQKTRLKQLESEVISAESDLSAMRSEKDELEQALLRDKEEVRGLQKMMKEVEDEKQGFKLILEKLRKEARQQKGMLSIAKKQLSTAEGARDAVQQEIKDAEREIEEDKLAIQTTHSQTEEAERATKAAAAVSPQSTGAFSPSTLPTAAGIPLPGTPNALSPAPTGASTRSNNPFDRFVGLARSTSQPPPVVTTPPAQTAAEPTSPGFGSIAAISAAAGVAVGAVAAEASSLYESAKEAVTGQSPETETKEIKDDEEADPFGAPALADGEKTPVPTTTTETDPFGAPTTNESTDPFGAPSTTASAQPAGFNDFDSGFGDSFTAQAPAAEAQPLTEELHLAPSSEPAVGTKPPADFDSAFAEFDQSEDKVDEEQLHNEGIPSGLPKSAIPADLAARPEAERTYSTQATAPTSEPGTPLTEIPSSFNASPSSERAPLPPSGLATEVKPIEVDEDEPTGESSDEEEEPEDLEAPRKELYKAKERSISPEPNFQAESVPEPRHEHVSAATSPDPLASLGPIAAPAQSHSGDFDVSPKVRRSAPPPPTSKSIPHPSADEFDPFGAPAPVHAAAPAQETSGFSLPPGAAPAAVGGAPQIASFDEDDFDFSDLPPAQVEQSKTSVVPNAAPAAAFDDEFATFDDDFEKPEVGNGSSENSGGSTSKSYEMVSPQPHGGYDEWGYGSHSRGQNQQHAPGGGAQGQIQSQPAGAGAGALSFDDAFGGDFEPASGTSNQETHYAPPAGVPPPQGGHHDQERLNPPPMPERRPSGAQEDDLEDVKKLCAMGFSRGLAVEALAANGYDFQKALNVLL
ncbi:hypothetical protein CI109_107005 [Kwoniella shandongensis]|uniref:Uncharacterized protein n=1 Tax=Kwoniella shandongensis TaxID=1734106 RepID=A0A5M6C613_9TREE|nr:uncharacterized protein CI109_000742 [Kwoniella shandongensis]KAA5530564.1 hypothetical protein CI109_000742 [Kwoniella shandongensis]